MRLLLCAAIAAGFIVTSHSHADDILLAIGEESAASTSTSGAPIVQAAVVVNAGDETEEEEDKYFEEDDCCSQKDHCQSGCEQKEGKGKGKGDECPCYLFGPDEAFSLSPENCHNLTFGGWTQLGYHDQVTPLSTVRGEGLSFNDVPDSLNLHQQWLYIEKSLETDECTWDWGGRVDLVYGTDAQKTQAFGTTSGWDNDWDHGVYGWALPQAYLEVGRGDLTIKGGHFYTLVGYEVVTAPDNFFYSHALTMFNSEPFTHTGVLATYSGIENLELYGGWTLGWDTGFRQADGGSSWLGGFSYSITEDISLIYISTAGNFGWRGKDAYSHSVVLDVTLTENLNYVFQSDLVSVGDTTGVPGGTPEDHDDDIGINQYLIYSVNDCLGFGTRLEWWKDEGNSHYEATFGLNYRPHANLVFRPEVRHDWQPYNNFDVTTVGMDLIVTY